MRWFPSKGKTGDNTEQDLTIYEHALEKHQAVTSRGLKIPCVPWVSRLEEKKPKKFVQSGLRSRSMVNPALSHHCHVLRATCFSIPPVSRSQSVVRASAQAVVAEDTWATMSIPMIRPLSYRRKTRTNSPGGKGTAQYCTTMAVHLRTGFFQLSTVGHFKW